MKEADELEGMTPELKAKVRAECIAAFTGKEKEELGRLQDLMLDAEIAEQRAVKKAVEKRAAKKQARKAAEEKWRGEAPDAYAYYCALKKVVALLPTKPPKELRERDFIAIKALVLLMLRRLGEFNLSKEAYDAQITNL